MKIGNLPKKFLDEKKVNEVLVIRTILSVIHERVDNDNPNNVAESGSYDCTTVIHNASQLR